MTSYTGPIKLRRRLFYVPQKNWEKSNKDVKICGDFTKPAWKIELTCMVDQTYGMYYYDVEVNDDQDVYFKFLSEGKTWCLSALYDTKPDDKNPHYINNYVRGCTLINEEDAIKATQLDEMCQVVANRLGLRNRAIENQLIKFLDLNPDLFHPKGLVDEKVYFVPRDINQYDKIKDQNLPVYLSGTLMNHEWLVNDEPCQIDPETNLYFARVRRYLNQQMVFKFKVGNPELGSYYESSTIYDNDGSAYVNNKLKTGNGSICDANYQLHKVLCT